MERIVRVESWPIAGTFRIARGGKTAADVVVVELSRGGHVGRGESVPYARYGESVEGVVAAIEALPPDLDRAELCGALPPGAARNALDCARWELEAREAGRPVHALAALPEPRALTCTFTLSVDAPDAMAAQARAHADRPLLKLKLDGGDADLPRLEAVHEAAPSAALLVDANESWSVATYERLAPRLAGLGVKLLEQPLPATEDAALASLPRPVPVCADESCHDRASLRDLDGRYDAVNVKLDKAGGLTEAIAVCRAARAAGLRIMVGCMVCTSLGVAPAALLGPWAQWVDLDGPLLLARDRAGGFRFEGATMHPSATWGA